MLYPSII